MMSGTRKTGRLERVALTMLIVLGLAWSQPFAASADDKLGESAIDSAMDQLGTDPTAEQPESPPPEATEVAPEAAADPAPDTTGEEAPATGDEAPAATDTAATDAPADGGADSAPSSETPAQAEPAATGGDAPTGTNSIALEQAAIENATGAAGGDSDNSNSNETPSLAEAAASNVLSGGSALGGALPINGGPQTDDDDAEADAANAAGNTDDTLRLATGLQAAGNDLRPSTITPRRDRGNREGNDADDNGTVVVNSLSDAGDQGKLAVHGHLVAGTLCDGSQFWSLDGGGTVNANGVNLSANGGTAATDATGGNDNIGGNAGNGGRANASADGGIVVVSELVTGNNRGNQVTVGNETFNGDCGSGVIDGGDVTTISNVNISADGGTAIADASGGNDNIAGGGGSAGNGGRANASADGGLVIVGSLILGNNEGNTINATGGSGSGGCLINGGSVRNVNNIDISADGGTAIADASGGDDNVALGEDANAGNGGRARANADGGMILAGDIITGNNQGNTINADCGGGVGGAAGANGRVVVNGGSVLNETTINLNADGGTAIADASGGDGNIAFGPGSGDATAGNGGRALSDASGGVIQVGNIVTGNNTGNVIAIGANFAPVPGRNQDSAKPDKVRKIQKPAASQGKAAAGKAPAPAARTTKSVGVLPNTGTGPVATAGTQMASMLLLLGGFAAIGAAVLGHWAMQRQRPVLSRIEHRPSR